ncbi:hypothetical protein Tco_0288767, partial [Tanacetum coccineum]
MFASADSIKSFLLVVQVTFLLIMSLLDMFSFLLTEIEYADYVSAGHIEYADYVSAGHVL